MIEEKAVIIETHQGFAWVQTQRQSTCGSCNANKGCGTSVLEKVIGQKRTRLKVVNPSGFRTGDIVVLGLQDDALVKGSLLMYGLPLLCMFGFALMGAGIFNLYNWKYVEIAEIGFALGGLAIGFLTVMRMNIGINNNPAYQAVILRKADTNAREIRIV